MNILWLDRLTWDAEKEAYYTKYDNSFDYKYKNCSSIYITQFIFLCFSFLKPKTPLPYSADKQNYCRYNSEYKGQKEQKDGHDEYRRR